MNTHALFTEIYDIEDKGNFYSVITDTGKLPVYKSTLKQHVVDAELNTWEDKYADTVHRPNALTWLNDSYENLKSAVSSYFDFVEVTI